MRASVRIPPDARPVTPSYCRPLPRAHLDTRDQRASLLAMLLLHVVAAAWLLMREADPLPAPGADEALQVVFIDAPRSAPQPATVAAPAVDAASPAPAKGPAMQAPPS